ncbi:hypothetical protein PENSPDRAFT_740563 [Peniophora sp. CONT]|nr:hypothetical protein PENSPDRAFT_740563 [Peniophora sp. CONT]
MPEEILDSPDCTDERNRSVAHQGHVGKREDTLGLSDVPTRPGRDSETGAQDTDAGSSARPVGAAWALFTRRVNLRPPTLRLVLLVVTTFITAACAFLPADQCRDDVLAGMFVVEGFIAALFYPRLLLSKAALRSRQGSPLLLYGDIRLAQTEEHHHDGLRTIQRRIVNDWGISLLALVTLLGISSASLFVVLSSAEDRTTRPLVIAVSLAAAGILSVAFLFLSHRTGLLSSMAILTPESHPLTFTIRSSLPMTAALGSLLSLSLSILEATLPDIPRPIVIVIAGVETLVLLRWSFEVVLVLAFPVLAVGRIKYNAQTRFVLVFFILASPAIQFSGTSSSRDSNDASSDYCTLVDDCSTSLVTS